MMSMVFKFASERDIKEMRIDGKPMEDIIMESKVMARTPKTATFSGELTYVNNELLYRMAYGCYDEDDNEYYYSLFDLARDPSIIDKLLNL
jgi:hypothetical protein